MRSSLPRALLAAGYLTLIGVPPAWAQRATEFQMHGLGTFGDDQFWGGGLGIALRSQGRMRAGIYTSVGAFEGEVAVRPEGILSFHLNPYRRSGVSPYAGGGIALLLIRDASREYIVGVIGIEWRPGTGSGWFVEAGIGGGVRLALGHQLRRRAARR